MSTAPTGWTVPKTDWNSSTPITDGDLNRVEGNVGAIETGSRTIDPTQAPASNAGTLRNLLDWFANRVQALTGKTNWYDAPDTTLTSAATHIAAAAPHSGHETPTGAQAKVDAHATLTTAHGAVSAPTVSTMVVRDAAGRAQFVDGSVAADAATKGQVDAAARAVRLRTMFV